MPYLLVDGCVARFLSGITQLVGGRVHYTMKKDFVDEFKMGFYMLIILVTLIIYSLSFFAFFHNPFSISSSLHITIFFHLTFLFIPQHHILLHPPFSHYPSLYIDSSFYIPLYTPPYPFPTWK